VCQREINMRIWCEGAAWEGDGEEFGARRGRDLAREGGRIWRARGDELAGKTHGLGKLGEG